MQSALGVGGGTATRTSTNVAPTTNPGASENVLVGAVVSMGSASKDPDGGTLTFKWTLIGKPIGSAATLTSSSYPNPKFTVDLVGNYVLSLVTNDGKKDSVVASLSVTAAAANPAPVANASPAQTILIGATVTLTGAASTDANADKLTCK